MTKIVLTKPTVLLLAGLAWSAFAQEATTRIDRVQPNDATLDCGTIQSQQKLMADLIAVGDKSSTGVARATVGAAANMGGQVAGAAIAQTGGLFGGLLSKVAGGLAQQQAEQLVAPDANAQQRVAQAKARAEFLQALHHARECRADEPGFAGKKLSEEEFHNLAHGSSTVAAKPFALANVQPALSEPPKLLETALELKGDLKLAGKEIYISEYRVLFEVSGKVSANTRAGYMPGTSYGSTRSTIKYQVPEPDIAAYQAITDMAWADLKQRLAGAGIKLMDAEAFVAQHGAVYAATEPGSQPGAPVFAEENLGHTERKFLVMSPSGMKLHPRGIAGLGAGDLGKRMEFVKGKKDGVAVGVALTIAALETSGSGSSILNPDGASTAATEGMSIVMPPRQWTAQGHADAGGLTMTKGIAIPGSFATLKETGGFNSQDSGVNRALQIVGALGGVAANKSKTVEMDVLLDGPAATRMALSGLATFNQALSEKFKAGM